MQGIQRVDILAIGVHPDDIEMTCGATLAKQRSLGQTFGMLDLTGGEMGTRGSKPLRLEEANRAAEILGASFRTNLHMKDGLFKLSIENKIKIVRVIREARPKVIICNAVHDRHPDHGRAAKLVKDSWFLSGLRKIETKDAKGVPQERWRSKTLLNYIQDYMLEPDILVNVTGFMDVKMEAIRAYKSQFYDPDSSEPESPLTASYFLDQLKARCAAWGRQIGVEYAEGYNKECIVGVDDLMHIL